MSSYIKPTVHPETNQIEQAEWLDDYFGNHNYGVRFPSDGLVIRYDEYEWVNDAAILAMRIVKPLKSPITKEYTKEGKRIEVKEHANGRRDTTVEVNSLQVDMSDPRNAKAKEVIERDVLPAIANKQITVTVIYKPTNEHASFVCARKNVHEYAMRIVSAKGGETNDYCLVENDGDNIAVTSL